MLPQAIFCAIGSHGSIEEKRSVQDAHSREAEVYRRSGTNFSDSFKYPLDNIGILQYNVVESCNARYLSKGKEYPMISSQMLKGMLEGCILKIICERETYAYEISKQLESYGFGTVSEGTIYPIILRLQKNGQIEAVVKSSNSGPNRKYYHLTEKGKEALKDFAENWQALSSAVNLLMKEKNECDETLRHGGYYE